MRLYADENIDRLLVELLRERGHTVTSAVERGPGLEDETVLKTAFQGDAILLTEDKGFGELVTVRGQPCKGVVLLRLNALPRRDRRCRSGYRKFAGKAGGVRHGRSTRRHPLARHSRLTAGKVTPSSRP